MAKLIYFVVLKPLSLLPLPILYLLSDFLYFILYKIAGYRTSVVFANLKNSFPDKNSQEIKGIANRFYSHMCDLIVESIKMFSMKKEEALKRFKILNPEVADVYFDQNRPVNLIAGHFNNWEMAGMACNPQFKHPCYAIYSPLSNKFFNRKIEQSRSTLGLTMIPKKQSRSWFAENGLKNNAMVFGADQSPTYSKEVYWTRFLNQDTAVMLGSEVFSTKYNRVAIFAKIKKVKRGYYEAEMIELDNDPKSSKFGEISEAHTRLLENQILEAPEFWLWTHKRWKRKVKEGDVVFDPANQKGKEKAI